MTYEEWVRDLPEEITGDSLWKMQAYRIALFCVDLGWSDSVKLAHNHSMIGLSDQLYRSLGSISANIAEGYSRGTSRDRAHFYEYALGSARESRTWYFLARRALGNNVISHRLSLVTYLIRSLLKIIPQQRGYRTRESPDVYKISQINMVIESERVLLDLLTDVPLA